MKLGLISCRVSSLAVSSIVLLAGCSGAPPSSSGSGGAGGGVGATSTTSSGSSSSGATSSSSGPSSSSGAPATCGDGKVDPGEQCDAGGKPSPTCNPDCTASACGDGVRNAAAGEECDDGNTKDGDACSSSCKVTAFVLEPQYTTYSSGSTVPIAAAKDRFLTLWGREDLNGSSTLKYAVFGAKGEAIVPASALAMQAGALVGANASGRGLLAQWDTNGFSMRYTHPDGTLEAQTHTPQTPMYFGGQPVAGADGRFCVFSGTGEVRCTTQSDDLGPGSVLVPQGNQTFPVQATMLTARGQGFVASYTVKLQSGVELRMRVLDANGAPLGPEVPLMQAPDTAGLAPLVGLAAADGTFGFGYTVNQEARWVVFDQNGNGDISNSTVLATGASGLGYVVHPSGRMLLLTRTVDEKLDPQLKQIISTCSIHAQVYGPDLKPAGAPFEVYTAKYGVCALPPNGAVDDAGDVMIGYSRYVDGALPAQTTTEAKIYPGLLGG